MATAAAAVATAEALAATEAQADGAQKAILDARIAEFKATADTKGIDIADDDFDTITAQQLETLAATRLA